MTMMRCKGWTPCENFCRANVEIRLQSALLEKWTFRITNTGSSNIQSKSKSDFDRRWKWRPIHSFFQRHRCILRPEGFPDRVLPCIPSVHTNIRVSRPKSRKRTRYSQNSRRPTWTRRVCTGLGRVMVCWESRSAQQRVVVEWMGIWRMKSDGWRWRVRRRRIGQIRLSRCRP